MDRGRDMQRYVSLLCIAYVLVNVYYLRKIFGKMARIVFLRNLHQTSIFPRLLCLKFNFTFTFLKIQCCKTEISLHISNYITQKGFQKGRKIIQNVIILKNEAM